MAYLALKLTNEPRMKQHTWQKVKIFMIIIMHCHMVDMPNAFAGLWIPCINLALKLFKWIKELVPVMLCFCLYSSLYTTFWYSKLICILQSSLEISHQDVKSGIWHWIVSTRKALSTILATKSYSSLQHSLMLLQCMHNKF